MLGLYLDDAEDGVHGGCQALRVSFRQTSSPEKERTGAVTRKR
jgi:hypothetical protein